MRKPHAFILLAAGALLLFRQQASAALDYTPQTGWTVEGSNEEASTEATAGAQLARAEAYEKAGDYHRAMVAYTMLTRKFPRSAAAADAQMKAGDMAVRAGDYDRAYAIFNDYMTKYPKGDDFDQALQGMYNIGQKFLAGAPRRVMGVKTFPSMVRAQNIFENIVKTAPFSKWAPLAQFYAGQALEKQKRYDEAITAYDEAISRYPSDPAAADAQYQIGYVYMVESRTAYDKTAASKAQEAFQDFLARYPSSEKAAQAQDNLKLLQNRENTNAVEVAKYYDKKKNYRAAVIYYNEVIKEQPGSPEAKAASDRIAALKAKLGDAALEPDHPVSGERLAEQHKLQAQVATVSRSDYVGPPVAEPTPEPADTPHPKPPLRSSADDLNPNPQPPAVEPPLPAQ